MKWNAFLAKHITVWKCITLFYLSQITRLSFIFATIPKIKNHPALLSLSPRIQVKQYEFCKLPQKPLSDLFFSASAKGGVLFLCSVFFSRIAKQRITAESDFSREFGRTIRRGQRHIGIRFQTVVRGQKGFHPHGQKVAKSIFLSFLALRGRRWFSSLIFLWSGGTSGTPAASIFSSLRPLPSIWARADVDTRTGLFLCTHHRAKAVYEAAINLSVYVRTVLKLKEAARVL